MDINARVYWNLHKGQWSIQDRRTGLVVGRQRVLLEGKKNVHAFAEGWYPEVWISPKFYHDEGRSVTYNPYKNDTFVYVDNGEPVGEVGSIWLTTTAEGKPSVKVYS